MEPDKDFVIGDRVVKSNPFFPGASTKQCLAIESEMRKIYQKSDRVIAPQHIWTMPDGKLILKKEYWLTVDQMLELMQRALRAHDPKTKVVLSTVSVLEMRRLLRRASGHEVVRL